MMCDWRVAQAPLRTRIYRLRTLHGMTQRDVAAHVGIHPLAYGRAERGQRRLRRPEIVALANLYGITISELLIAPQAPTVHEREYAQ